MSIRGLIKLETAMVALMVVLMGVVGTFTKQWQAHVDQTLNEHDVVIQDSRLQLKEISTKLDILLKRR